MCFWAGNMWLIIALTLWIGKTYVRSEPTMVSFFGEGQSMYPSTYGLLVIVCLALGIYFLWMWKRQEKLSPQAVV